MTGIDILILFHIAIDESLYFLSMINTTSSPIDNIFRAI